MFTEEPVGYFKWIERSFGPVPQSDPSQPADPNVGMSVIDHATYEESVVRVKDFKDLALPSPPDNAGQARGFVNQVLMAIGRLQKDPRRQSIPAGPSVYVLL